ncbi:phage/plasmid primase, P4 family [Faunimonas sp. B44]|uniref:phage/plasmid primase, P4 family n=1 Tax=Faunimonas sp. B44 TaxID=3461493 RepID=UPI004044CA12
MLARAPDNLSAEAVARALGGDVQSCGRSVLAPGPGHSPADRSLSITLDPKAAEGFLCHSFAGDDWQACRDHVRHKLGLPDWQPAAPANGHAFEAKAARASRTIVATYDYRDERGTTLFQAVRFEPKGFAQRRPDGRGGWLWGVQGVRLVPYRLPDMLAAVPDTVFIVEGEKDADRLAAAGFVATTNPMGAGKWRAEYAAHFAGRDCYILPDNDEPGRKRAEQVAASLLPVAATVRIVELPGLRPKGDVSDWLDLDPGNRGRLVDIAKAAPPFGEDDRQIPPHTDEAALDRLPDNHDARPPAFTDEALALRFAEKHRHDLRYVAGWGKWLQWDGKRWTLDDTLLAFDKARNVCRAAAAECNKSKIAAALASAKTVAAIERLAKADRRLAATAGQWDADPWSLNTPAGIVDLRTGRMRDHAPDEHMTRMTAVAPAGKCPTFLAFLGRIMAGDEELVAFLQRVFGYALTGSTREHALFFGYGTGANGKSVLLSTVAGILGDYHKTAPIETFTASSGDRHPTDLAGLRGARLVTAVETEEGRRWAESRIKTLTGGDPISARFMRQDFFEYVPQFKLAIAGNHKPGLRSVDEAIRRRFHLIPFAVTIPPAERDTDLTEKLKAEWPGILAWMVEGCREWQASGLRPPKAVTDATAAYLEAEDAVAAWLDEACERDPSATALSSTAFASWKLWAAAAGEHVGSQKKFIAALENRGFHRRHTMHGSGLDGLKIKPRPEGSDPWWDR